MPPAPKTVSIAPQTTFCLSPDRSLFTYPLTSPLNAILIYNYFTVLPAISQPLSHHSYPLIQLTIDNLKSSFFVTMLSRYHALSRNTESGGYASFYFANRQKIRTIISFSIIKFLLLRLSFILCPIDCRNKKGLYCG